MEFYKNVLGGVFEGGLKSYADGAEHMPYKPEHADKVIGAFKNNRFFVNGVKQ